MVIQCSAVGCANRQGRKQGVSFYRFPTKEERRNRWISALKRENWLPSSVSRICSEHFMSGAKSNDPLSPDFVPSVFVYTKSNQKKSEEKCHRFFQMKKLKRKREESTTLPSVLPSKPESSVVLSNNHCGNNQTSQTDLTNWDILNLEKNTCFREKGSLSNMFSEEAFENNEEAVKTITGLPSFDIMMAVFGTIQEHLPKQGLLSPFKQFVVTMLKLKHNLNFNLIAYMFGVHVTTISRTFCTVIDVLNARFVPISLFWPGRNEVLRTMPLCFQRCFKTTTCIIDCFEVRIDKPTLFKARAQTYSQYKKHNTVKYLIGISPQGFISFISKGWGGRTSDPYLTANSGFLNNLLPGDLILADRGFTITETVGLYCARVETPAFTRGKKQLSAIELEKSRDLAAVRIHVERVIGLVRRKYRILQGQIPIKFLHTTNDSFATIDKIVRVACALTNVCPSVVPFD